jgi:glycosyltransferase involved in cell wall biosynthesis
VLVAALANCPPQVHLHLIGNPDTEFGRTVAATAKDNPRIHFIGYRNDVQRLLPAFDTFVQGSRREALSLSLIEAAAAGLPAVATAVGGVPEVIADGTTGILVPPEDPAAMGAALWRLVDTPAMGRAMGEAARKRYLEMFTEARMLEGTLAVYRSCLPQAEAGD